MNRYFMKSRYILSIAVLAIAAIFAAGCTGTRESGAAAPVPTPAEVGELYAPPEAITTTRELVEFVAHAAAYAREHGREKAAIAFNDPDGENNRLFSRWNIGNRVADAWSPARGPHIEYDRFRHTPVERFKETVRGYYYIQ